jgi:tripartite-type tricarboxylate transporter receptor subunit TctC
MLRRLLLASLVASAILPATPALRAQGVARHEPLKLVVGYPAGGSADAVARMLADKLKEELNTTVIVDNRPGAGGAIAAEYVKNAPADGHTLLIANTHMMVMIPLTFKVVRYNPVKDFQPVGRVSSFYEAIAVPSATRATTVGQWIDLARANTKDCSFGVPAPGSISQFIGFRLGKDANVDMLPVPYRGSAPLVQDLLGGQVAAGILPIADVAAHHQAGKLRVLAVNGPRRSELLPGVPTLSEIGLRQFDTLEWVGLFAPPATPRAVLQPLQAALARVLAMDDVKRGLAKIGMQSDPAAPDELGKLIADELGKWGPVVKASGFLVD